MNTTATVAGRTSARRPRLDRDRAMRLAATEYDRLLGLLRELTPEEWSRPTECAGWDVRAMAGHCVGMARMASGLRETLRQDRAARRRGGVFVDALTALQVEEQAHLTSDELVQRFADVGPRAARGRRRTPALVRRRTLPDEQDIGGTPERWTVGYLIDTILTRDPWMHRMDICRATGRPPYLTAEHDGLLVADVVDEWAERHGRPFRLDLAGPAGGTFTRGSGGPQLRMDAVDFCRVLSGRTLDDPVRHELLDTAVPF